MSAPKSFPPGRAPEPDDEFLGSFQVVWRDLRCEEREHLEGDGTPPRVTGAELKLAGQRYEYRDLGTTRFRKGGFEAAVLAAYREADEPAHRDHSLEQPVNGGVVVGFIHDRQGRRPIYRIGRAAQP